MTFPYIKIYVRDWMGDTQLRLCSLAARGFWWECLCLMHSAARRGFLETAGGVKIEDEELARLTGCFNGEYATVRAELLRHGVPGVEEATGIWYSRRMVRDAAKAARCAEAGKTGGGNPALKVAGAHSPTPPPEDKTIPIPDTRYHISIKDAFIGYLYRSAIPDVLQALPDFPEAWMAWLEFREAKKAPVTMRVVKTIATRLAQRPAEAVAALDTCIAAGWVDVRWDWIDNRNAPKPVGGGFQRPDPQDIPPERQQQLDAAMIDRIAAELLSVAKQTSHRLSPATAQSIAFSVSGSTAAARSAAWKRIQADPNYLALPDGGAY